MSAVECLSSVVGSSIANANNVATMYEENPGMVGDSLPPISSSSCADPSQYNSSTKASNMFDGMEADSQMDMDRMDQSDTDSRKNVSRQNHSEIEKRRRDKMNSYIMELSAMIPMCNAMSRKLDKLTVLRMAVQHMKTLRATANPFTEGNFKPSFLSEDELKHLILEAADGFLFVVSCDRGRILYVSESVARVLNYNQRDLMGQSWFDILHPKDVAKVKEQLLSSDMSPRERLIDAKTGLPVKADVPPMPSCLCSGARRSFFCRMKTGRVVKEEKYSPESVTPCSRKKERKHYLVIHCTGYLKSWQPSKMGIEEDNEADNEGCNLSCLVAVGRTQAVANPGIDSANINVKPLEFVSRLTIDHKFTFVDQRATTILGYLPQELLGTSSYEYYYYEDLPHLAESHKAVLTTKDKILTCVYRFRVKDGRFIGLRTKCFSFRNPWTKEVEYIVNTNTVVAPNGGNTPVSATPATLANLDSLYHYPMEAGKQKVPSVPGVPGGTRPGAGKIGRQIAEEIIEMHRSRASPSSHRGTPSPMGLDPGQNGGSPHTPMMTSPGKVIQGSPGTPNLVASSGMSQPSTSQASEGQPASLSPGHQEADAASPAIPCTHPNGLVLPPTLATTLPDISINTSDHGFPPELDPANLGGPENDEAAMAVIMSLLEADAGLGGPVDFSDIPWPL
ncbi:basic helix-loop-helix ARNT-like protein 1 isoform X2 [Branchiostoma lanceolatum]|uniref:basic helix-loop-helix ARNT-like protein 1 isoform X2 n=1 Tax=Branchiostoma lanceolatum TaxID=7740 RepID=UPI0034539267